MSHRIDFDSIHSNLFSLINFVYAAKNFAKSHDLSSSDESEPINYYYYWGWLEYNVSNILLDTAIKIRVTYDLITNYDKEYNIGELDKKYCEIYYTGYFITKGDVTVRELCNKIIHAKNVTLNFDEGDEDHDLDEESEVKREWKYWNGVVELTGQKASQEWTVAIIVSEFCLAIEEFLKRLEADFDWQKIYS